MKEIGLDINMASFFQSVRVKITEKTTKLFIVESVSAVIVNYVPLRGIASQHSWRVIGK